MASSLFGTNTYNGSGYTYDDWQKMVEWLKANNPDAYNSYNHDSAAAFESKYGNHEKLLNEWYAATNPEEVAAYNAAKEREEKARSLPYDQNAHTWINPVTGKPFTDKEFEDAMAQFGFDVNETAQQSYDKYGGEEAASKAFYEALLKYTEWAQAEAAGQTQVDNSTGANTEGTESNDGTTAQFDTPAATTTEDSAPDYTGRKNAVDVQQAIAEGAQTAQTESENNAVAAASAGVNKSRAGMLSDNASQQTQANNVSNVASANSAQAASTQADYLKKMSQADALDQQAKNMKSGAALTAIGGGIQGAASGAIAGAIVSDEDLKEPIDFDQQLYDSIRQFRELYLRVKKLREDTK